MSINTIQLRDHVIVPALHYLEPQVPENGHAVNLLMGTAAQESGMGTYIDQATPGPGPAYGIYQMERFTHNSNLDRLAQRNRILYDKVRAIIVPALIGVNDVEEMAGNLYYATVMCRIHYWLAPELVPTNIEGYAFFWKKRYNTFLGAGTTAQFIASYKRHVGSAAVIVP